MPTQAKLLQPGDYVWEISDFSKIFQVLGYSPELQRYAIRALTYDGRLFRCPDKRCAASRNPQGLAGCVICSRNRRPAELRRLTADELQLYRSENMLPQKERT